MSFLESSRKFKSYILESVSSEVYHYTSLGKAYEIVKTNEFQLTTSLGTQSDRLGKDKFYYLSVSRIKYGGYSRNAIEGVHFVLDGDKFNQRYTGGPVDYWGPSFWQNPELSKDQRMKSNENEERILSDDPVIPKALSYIKEVHILTKPDDLPYEASKLMKLLEDKGQGYKIFWYTDQKAWSLMDKRKSQYDAEGRERYMNEVTKVLKIYEYLGKGNVQEAERLDYSLVSDLRTIKGVPYESAKEYMRDRVRSMENDIHNARTGNKGLIADLTQLMKKERVRSIVDLLIKMSLMV